MRNKDVEVGRCYHAKVSGRRAIVSVDAVHPWGGWVGTNQQTGRKVKIKSGRRLHRPVTGVLDLIRGY